jgi:hypothetical protein
MDKAAVVGFLSLLAALAGIGYHVMDIKHFDVSAEYTKYQAWEEWKAKYGKSYEFQELPLKYAVFSTNYDFIQKHNSENHKYTVGLNEFADLTQQEFASFRMPITQDGGITNG